jgi:hypothetical protein
MERGADLMSDRRKNNIFEVLDELIFHLNTTKSMFTFLIVSSFILAPLAIIVAAIFAFNPRFLPFIIDRVPGVATIVIAFIVIVVILASVWLAIGIKERAFFSAWNTRFSRFVSLRERIDRELEEGTSDEGPGKNSEKREGQEED